MIPLYVVAGNVRKPSAAVAAAVLMLFTSPVNPISAGAAVPQSFRPVSLAAVVTPSSAPEAAPFEPRRGSSLSVRASNTGPTAPLLPNICTPWSV